MNGKQRTYLKKLAHDMQPLFQIGKNGITENFIEQINQALDARELIKCKVLNNSLLDAKETANELARVTNAEFVQAIGNKFTLYRESKDNKKIVLPRV
ncbi:ribosome assembly RNA-binding protein YhbY [Gottschalkiaceae bacterium SANA]|jgi:RNA-binding protein|nr:ribosome assembly RNA-binding protein YhbY [Gottschalkiaceae bacterium SANA]